MMMNDRSIQLYDIWRMAYEFEDKPGLVKERPVIIGAIDDENAYVLAVKVTSHKARADFLGEVVLQDWQEAGLDKPSVARCSKALIVPLEAFEAQRYYGHLSNRDSLEIERALIDLGKIN